MCACVHVCIGLGDSVNGRRKCVKSSSTELVCVHSELLQILGMQAVTWRICKHDDMDNMRQCVTKYRCMSKCAQRSWMLLEGNVFQLILRH